MPSYQLQEAQRAGGTQVPLSFSLGYFFFQPQSIEKPSKLEKRPGPGEAEKRKLQPPLYSMSR